MKLSDRIRRLEVIEGGLKPLLRDEDETAESFFRRVCAAPLNVRRISHTGYHKPGCRWDWETLQHIRLDEV